MTNKYLSIFNQIVPTVGFDNIFDHFERMFDDEVLQMHCNQFLQYPKTGENTYDIEVHGRFYKDDIEVEYAEICYINQKS